MNRTVKMLLTVLAAIGLFLSLASAQVSKNPRLAAATGKLKPATIPAVRGRGPAMAPIATRKEAPFFSASSLVTLQSALKASGLKAAAPAASAIAAQAETVGCGNRNPDGNVRVNQDCGFRSQAEEGIAFNPVNPNNLIAGMNDGRVGFNQCSIAFSLDNGQHWGDQLPPFRARVNSNPPGHAIGSTPRDATLHTYDAASDPGVAFDSQGRGFFSCVAFDLADAANMIFVAESPSVGQGSFFNIIPSGLALGEPDFFVAAEDNNPNISYDKPFLTADRSSTSPNRDNVYATWTVFTFDAACVSTSNPGGFCSSPIYASMSTDNAFHWSPPQVISGNSASLCVLGNFFDPRANAGDCNFDQGSDPVVLPNGDLVVIFNNGNTPSTTNQQLAVRCHPALGSMNCSSPTKVGDDFTGGAPICNFGTTAQPDIRECIPGAFVRTNDFPRVGMNPNNANLYVAWQDYRNGEFDIQLASSTDGGSTWGNSVTVNPDVGLDHYFAAVAVAGSSDDEGDGSGRDRVGVSYFRSQRVVGENTFPGVFTPADPGVQQANSDYVLAGGSNTNAPFNFKVVSSIFGPPDGGQTGFNGDYSGLTINKGTQAHPIWSDTRNPILSTGFHDADVFTVSVTIPHGTARSQTGLVGQGSGKD